MLKRRYSIKDLGPRKKQNEMQKSTNFCKLDRKVAETPSFKKSINYFLSFVGKKLLPKRNFVACARFSTAAKTTKIQLDYT